MRDFFLDDLRLIMQTRKGVKQVEMSHDRVRCASC